MRIKDVKVTESNPERHAEQHYFKLLSNYDGNNGISLLLVNSDNISVLSCFNMFIACVADELNRHTVRKFSG